MTLREQAKIKVRQNIEKILMDFHNQRCADISGAVDCIFLNFEEYLSLLSKEGKEVDLPFECQACAPYVKTLVTAANAERDALQAQLDKANEEVQRLRHTDTPKM